LILVISIQPIQSRIYALGAIHCLSIREISPVPYGLPLELQ